jgi:hypothetical protein
MSDQDKVERAKIARLVKKNNGKAIARIRRSIADAKGDRAIHNPATAQLRSEVT